MSFYILFQNVPGVTNRIFHTYTSIYDSLLYLPLNACWGTTHHKYILHLIYVLILITNHDVGERHNTNMF